MSKAEIFSELWAASPQDPAQLDDEHLRMLRTYTDQLLASGTATPIATYDRFLPQRDTGITFKADAMADHIGGKRVLITGGNGCIGMALSTELLKFDPALIVTLGTTAIASDVLRAPIRSEYADIRDGQAIDSAFDAIRPDIVYHLAGQRNVGAAESDMRRSLEVNILGTQNVVNATLRHRVAQTVYASSEKTLSPYVTDTYSVSKKASEWILSNADGSNNVAFSIARLAHITGNSVIFGLIQQWTQKDMPIRLFGADTSFYIQTATEAAQTLMIAGHEADTAITKTFAAKELGEPVGLPDLALGAIAITGSQSVIYFSKSTPGYETVQLPPIFGHVKEPVIMPLVGQFERARMSTASACDQIAVIPNRATDGVQIQAILAELTSSHDVDAAMYKVHLASALLDSTLSTLDSTTLKEALAYYESSGELSKPSETIVEALEHALKLAA